MYLLNLEPTNNSTTLIKYDRKLLWFPKLQGKYTYKIIKKIFHNFSFSDACYQPLPFNNRRGEKEKDSTLL